MKNLAIWLYQQATSVARRKRFAALQAAGNMPIAILFYHRIADEHPNDWTMSCRDFARQLDWLQKRFDVVSLVEAQQRIQSGSNARPTVSITFDDGYADNSLFAIPELARRGLPATYFVSTGFVANQAAFPHDVKAGQPLAPNSIQQLREYQDMGIEIGAHTQSHCDLGKIHQRQQVTDEIVGSIKQLESWLGRQVRYFAFPFGLPGNMSQVAVDVMREHGLAGFCSAYGAWNWANTQGVHMRRIHADPGLVRLQNWLTLDPRKLRLEYELPFSEPQRSRWHVKSPQNATGADVDSDSSRAEKQPESDQGGAAVASPLPVFTPGTPESLPDAQLNS